MDKNGTFYSFSKSNNYPGIFYICLMSLIRKSMTELNRPNLEGSKLNAKLPLVVILEDIRSGLNIGSVFRTADGMNIEKIILTGISVIPPHREILKTALDSTLSVHWEYYASTTDVILALKNKGYKIAAVEQVHHSKSLETLNVKDSLPLALIFGNEVRGVSDKALEMSDFGIEIPQHGIKHSLNISVCAGIVLWHCYAQLLKPKIH